ncbi:hypothetical protein [Aquabacterium olei]|uniref:hypothetical protein n=1 Tax=Aquabacterium olei TaxID=1296669 RepID=UPI0015CFA079|nr:hypothetical protein [Aquabacterium olei]
MPSTPHHSPLSDLLRGLGVDAGGAREPAPPPENDAATDAELDRWHELVAQVGRELAEPLTAALERVTTLTTTGRIDRLGLRALRAEVDRARQAGIWCQQIARLASGRVRQSPERVHLTHTVQSTLAYRTRELQARGIQLSQSLLPLEVLTDASMLFSLLNALIDWLLEAAHGVVELRIDQRDWPARARLQARLQHRPLDEARPPSPELLQHRLDTMHWHLLDQTARSMALLIDRQIDATHAVLTLEFPRTVNAVMPQLDDDDQYHGFSTSVNSKPLAGSHVLVVASRRDLRVQIREASRDMGLVMDFVGSVREARAFCDEGLPHAIVFEGLLRGRAFDELVASIRQEVPEFVFIEVAEQGQSFEASTLSGTGMARIGADGIASNLPSALVFELSRIM